MATRIQLRRDTAANWQSVNPVLAQGELGLNLDTNQVKLGDGVTAWNSLSYTNFSIDIDELDGVTITDPQNGDFLRYSSSASAWINDPVNLSTDTVGDYVQSLVAGTGVSLANNSGEGSTPTIAIGQAVGTSSSVTFAHVNAPLTGNVIGNVTGDVSGNAGTASTLQTARTISLTGDVSGSVSFNGSSDVSITAVVQPNSVALGTDTTGNYVNDVTAGTGITVTHTPGEGSSPTIAIGQAVGTSSSVTFAHVSAPVTGNVIGDLTGNADTASTLETSRTIAISGDVSGSVSFDGSADVTISATIQPNSVALGTDTTGNYVNDVTAGTGVTVTHTPAEGSSPTIAIGQAVGTSSSVTFAHVSAPLTGDVTGNASTASALQTARTIAINGDVSGSVSFDGSANATINATIQPNSVALGTDTTGNYVNDVTAGTGVTVTHTPGEGSSPTIAIGQAVGTSSSVTFAHVTADVTGDLTGNADTATALATARTIELSGDVSGSASFDGTSSINIFTTVNTSSVAIGELDGVNITNPEEYQVIQYNGTEWVNEWPDTVSYARNVDTVTLQPGTVVYIYGGNGDHVTVKRADNSSDTTSAKTLGVVGVAIPVNQNGPVVTQGYVDQIDFSTGYNVGDILWLAKNGALTTTKPSAPDHMVFVGVVVRATNNGIMFVSAQNGYELEELHDVKIISPSDGQFLRYNSASTIWVNDAINLGTDTIGNYVSDVSGGTGVTVNHIASEGSTPTISIGQDVSTSASVTFAQVTVQGDLDVQGTITRINETNLEIEDSFIYLNATSASVNPDFGIAANYNDGTYRHAGFFRDSSDGIFKIFDNYEPEPQNPINVSDPSYSDAPLQAERFISTIPTGTAPFSVSSSTAVTNLNADKLDGYDSSYFAPIDSPTFTGTVSLPNNTVALGTQTTGNYVADVTGGTGVNIVHTPGEGTSPQVSIGQDVATSASVTFAHVSAPLTGNVTGNASTASTLQTARTISLSGDLSGSVSFNGSSNVDITATIQPNSVALGTDTTGNYVAEISAFPGSGLNVSSPGESATIFIGSNATDSNSASAIVKRDENGNFSAGTITADLSGNATTATQLDNARIIELSGDVSGSVYFDGSANVNISTAVQPNSVALGTDTTGNYVNDITAGTGVTVTHTPGEGSSPTVAIGQAVATSSSVTFAHVSAPVTGNVIGNVTGDVSGNAGTASTLQTARTISITGDVSGSVSFNGSSDVSISTTVQPNSVALGTDTTGNYVSDVTAGTGISVSHTPGEGSSASVSLNATLDDLSNVLVASPVNGDYLTFNGTNWVSASLGSSAITVSDTAPGSPSEGDLWFDSSSFDTFVYYDGTWLQQNTPPSEIAELSDLVDVSVLNALPGDLLQYDGTDWVNVSVVTTASVANALLASRVISLSGDVSGSVSFDGSQNVTISTTVQPNSVALGTDTTGNYVSNLTAGTGVTVTHTPGEGSSPTVAIGQDIGTSASVTFGKVTTTGDAVIGGNLTVNGTTTTINTETLEVEDNIIVLNSNASGAPSTNAGIEIERGSSTNVVLRWNESSDKWEITNDGSSYGVIATLGGITLGTDTAGNYMADVSSGTGVTVSHTPGEASTATISIGQNVGTSSSVQFAAVTAPVIGNVTGNADTATTLQTSRTISLSGDVTGSVSFNGSADATISATIQANSVALGTDTTGNYMADVSAGTGITVSHTPSEGSTATISISDAAISSKSNNYTLALADKRTVIEMNIGSANTLTVPPNSSVAFPVGAEITVYQYGGGKTQILAGSGVTIRSTPGNYLRAQYSVATLIKRATDEWILFGDLSAT